MPHTIQYFLDYSNNSSSITSSKQSLLNISLHFLILDRSSPGLFLDYPTIWSTTFQCSRPLIGRGNSDLPSSMDSRTKSFCTLVHPDGAARVSSGDLIASCGTFTANIDSAVGRYVVKSRVSYEAFQLFVQALDDCEKIPLSRSTAADLLKLSEEFQFDDLTKRVTPYLQSVSDSLSTQDLAMQSVSLVNSNVSSQTKFEIVGSHDIDTFPVTIKVTLATCVRGYLESEMTNEKYENLLEVEKTRLDDRVVINCDNNVEMIHSVLDGLMKSRPALACNFMLTWSEVDGILIKNIFQWRNVYRLVADLFGHFECIFGRIEGDYETAAIFSGIADDFCLLPK
jgi:hypothetical protein